MKYKIILGVVGVFISYWSVGWAAEPAAPPRTLPIYFMTQQDYCDARHVSIQVHTPINKHPEILFPRPADKLSAWMMPVASEQSDSGIRLWYQRVDKTEAEYVNQRVLSMAELKDGKLVLPDLGVIPSPWPDEPNVVMQRSPHKPTWGGFNVFQILPAPSPSSGYVMLYWDQPPQGEAGAMPARSQDGIHWNKEDRETVFTEHNDAYSLIWNPTVSEYWLYQTKLEPWPDKPFPDNLDKWKRVISLRKSRDLKTWTPQEVILQPDENDPRPLEFYLLKVFPYGGRFAGLLMRYQADPDRPNLHGSRTTTELIVSDDGLHWQRPFRDVELGFWSYADPFTIQNSLCFAVYDKNGLALFRYPLDGLTSCGPSTDAGTEDNYGEFTTPLFQMPDSPLQLSFDAGKGDVSVSILNEKGRVLRGFTASRCRFRGVSGIDTPLEWSGRQTHKLAGRLVCLRFELHHARIFALKRLNAE